MMIKIKDGFILQQTGNSYLITSSLPDTIKSPKIFAINESGALLWNELINGTDKPHLLNILKNEYETDDTDNVEVMNDIDEFLNTLRIMEVLEGE